LEVIASAYGFFEGTLSREVASAVGTFAGLTMLYQGVRGRPSFSMALILPSVHPLPLSASLRVAPESRDSKSRPATIQGPRCVQFYKTS
jgi:hypothetical protein